MKEALVFNIQRFSIHDGEGIRSTVFFKGCGLHCKWCHNPESQSYQKQIIRYEERCKNCKACMNFCPHQGIKEVKGKIELDRKNCHTCGTCLDYCVYNALEIAGKPYTANQLVEIVKRDRMLYEESGGGVTLSGGEVMSQSIGFLLELCKKLKRLGIHITIDTCGLAPRESYQQLVPYVDAFLYDIKTIDQQKHELFVGDGLETILDNLIEINKMDAIITIRVAVIGGFNDREKEIQEMIQWLVMNQIKVKKIDLLPYHEAGSIKYQRLGRSYEKKKMSVPSPEKMEAIKNIFIEHGFQNISIGG
ncbi:glycyl-radical enzyme activating protein [Tindallia californiensis]|uniref:Pyruvate formate lyase activating enzyme n=1 Tax=Tindallia californiensis TaxID=159292 RepID=A0A1H3LQN7_9FIRM|nr:glycyl-radical enzyme activating protein [Tindallia californiensis]SDY66752.1 pyruvate formate lyase activating enzyme [Tindallia californiensis]